MDAISPRQLSSPPPVEHCLPIRRLLWFWRRSRYFRGKRFFGDFEIHVEQADIKDLTVTASAERGCTVSMAVLSPSGSRVVRSFRPDFFLCRQSVRDASKDYRNVLLGLNIGGVPSINSLHSLYNFQVRKPLPTCDTYSINTDHVIFFFLYSFPDEVI